MQCEFYHFSVYFSFFFLAKLKISHCCGLYRARSTHFFWANEIMIYFYAIFFLFASLKIRRLCESARNGDGLSNNGGQGMNVVFFSTTDYTQTHTNTQTRESARDACLYSVCVFVCSISTVAGWRVAPYSSAFLFSLSLFHTHCIHLCVMCVPSLAVWLRFNTQTSYSYAHVSDAHAMRICNALLTVHVQLWLLWCSHTQYTYIGSVNMRICAVCASCIVHVCILGRAACATPLHTRRNVIVMADWHTPCGECLSRSGQLPYYRNQANSHSTVVERETNWLMREQNSNYDMEKCEQQFFFLFCSKASASVYLFIYLFINQQKCTKIT